MNPFEAQLERVLQGEIEAGPFLEAFVDGLGQWLAQFEAALEPHPEELVEAMQPYLEEITARLDRCEELAETAFQTDSPREALLELRQVHTEVNQWALAFRDAMWEAHGPTPVAWVNRILESGRRYLGGASLEFGLSQLLDHHLRELEGRLAGQGGPPSASRLVESLRELQGWARGATDLGGLELEQAFAHLVTTTEAAADWVREGGLWGVSRLLETLEAHTEPEMVLLAVDGALLEVRRLASRFEMTAAAAEAWGQTREISAAIGDTLAEFDDTLMAIAEAVDEAEEVDLAGPVRDLKTRLDAQVAHLQEVAAREGTAPCPACGHLNALHRRLCSNCTVKLPAIQGADQHLLDLSEDEQGGMEHENILKLRQACLGFQQGTSPLSLLSERLAQFQEAIVRARQLVPGTEAPNEGRLYLGALDDLELAVQTLSQVEVPQDLSLERGLSLLLRGARRLQQAQERVQNAS